jgi:hypothetical protein
MAETSTLRPGGEWEMALNRPQHFLGSMSQLGPKADLNQRMTDVRSSLQQRTLIRATAISVFAQPKADIATAR